METVRVEDGYVILNDGQMWDYDIPLRDLETEHGLQRWIDHLSEKKWVTPFMLQEVRRFASRARTAAFINSYEGLPLSAEPGRGFE